MRKTFYDLLESMKFDIYTEYDRLHHLFYEENSVSIYGYLNPLSKYIDKFCFRDFKYRGSFTSMDDMISELNIDYPSNDLDSLFVFCEFLISLMSINIKDTQALEQFRIIKDNICHILEKTNHELLQRPDHKDQNIIVEKNKATTLVAEMVEDQDVAFKLLEYNHYAIKGNLSKKRAILNSIGTYIEPILRDNTLSKAGYKDLESNVGFLLNKFHIRHNNKEGKTAQEYILSINDRELEKWYDKTYDILMQAILTSENIPIENEITQLKKAYKWI